MGEDSRNSSGAEDPIDDDLVCKEDPYQVTIKRSDASQSLLTKTEKPTGSSKSTRSWTRFLPFNCWKRQGLSPKKNAGFFEYATLMWLSPIIYKGFGHTLMPEDLGNLAREETAGYCRKRFIQLANIEGTNAKDVEDLHIGRVFFRVVKKKYLLSLLFYFIWLNCQFCTAAFAVRFVLSYVESSSDKPIWDGLRWAVLLFFMESIRTVCSCNVFFRMSQAGVILRATMLSLVYGKIIKLKNVGDKSVGELINLCANDSQRLFECAQFSIFLVGAVYLTILSAVFVSIYFGTSALVGIGVILLFIPLQGTIGKLIGRLRQKTVIITDRRVRLMSEILTCIKLIKMYAWEKPFSSVIMGLRMREKNKLKLLLFMQSFNFAMGFLFPVLAAVVVFIVHSLIGLPLTAVEAYTIIALFNGFPSTLSLLPVAVKSITEAGVAIKRLKNLLTMDDLEVYSIEPKSPDIGLRITDGDFSWDKVVPAPIKAKNASPVVGKAEASENGVVKNGFAKQNGSSHGNSSVKDKKMENNFTTVHKMLVPVLNDVTFSVPKGSTVGVCGPVGCGKSSLIEAILGQMTMTKGTVEVETPISYVPQQAWIMNSTARENILFGKEYNPALYEAVSEACSLKHDFDVLPSGDLTEIGERGINLSGGQKQRLSLARAIYNKDGNTYLLDDPLSAVDAHVGKHIFEECIRGLLKNKTVLFVTHQLQYLSDCDSVLYIINGRIVENGSYSQLIADDKEFAAMMHKFHPIKDTPDIPKVLLNSTTDLLSQNGTCISAVSLLRAQSVVESMIDEELEQDKEAEGKLIAVEERASGSVSAREYRTYARAAGGYIVVFLTLFMIATVIGGTAVTEWWLTRFLTAYKNYEENHAINGSRVSLSDFPDTNLYITIYGLMAVCELVLILFSVVLSMTTFLRASSNLHNSAFMSILRSPMAFFDATPTGRILNRLSKDVDELDTMLPWLLENFLRNSLRLIVSFTIMAVIFPWFLIVVGVLFILFLLLNIFFRRTVRQLKRLDNTTRSPVFSHITATVQGLSTLHAYGRDEVFSQQFHSLVDDNTLPFLLFALSSRWFAIRLDFLGVLVSTSIAVLVVLLKGSVPSALAGLALTYSLRVTGLLQFTSRTAAETEARFTCVERLSQYAYNIAQEATTLAGKFTPSKSWPDRGAITFKNVCLRYREEMPLVLRDINISIEAEDKIGVVGRTGAGKSSLAVALFRLTELDSGSITIDDTDISSIELHQLRSSLSVIPQDPVLFVGTLRYNLDPFDAESDEKVWDALRKAHLTSMVEELPLKLQTHVVENGANFSVGERQLICMARALLRSSKILILDEATAAIDSETDSKIQDMIRSSFKSCTMLTIAHRINTVMDCDKILVLDEGKVVEFNSPEELLANPKSAFAKMVAASDSGKYAPPANDSANNIKEK